MSIRHTNAEEGAPGAGSDTGSEGSSSSASEPDGSSRGSDGSDNSAAPDGSDPSEVPDPADNAEESDQGDEVQQGEPDDLNESIGSSDDAQVPADEMPANLNGAIETAEDQTDAQTTGSTDQNEPLESEPEAPVPNGAGTGDAAGTSETGDAGIGGGSSDAGNGGNGGSGGGGGSTGSQSGTSTEDSAGGSGGNGGGAAIVASTTLPFDTSTSTASTTDTVATTTSTSTASTTLAQPNPFATSTATDIITTGDAIANANLLNVLNTNLVNSYGELLFLSNMFAEQVGRVDFRKLSLFGLGDSLYCIVCTGSSTLDMEIRNRSYASTTNGISADASTGGNIMSTPGNGYISTGNAYAAGNIMNFVNNNLVDSNYLFLTYNNFGDWGGDIVFPDAETFLDIFGSSLPSGFANSMIDARNLNEAVIENMLDLDASTGNNDLMTSTGTGAVSTGKASTSVNSLNLTNSNLIGGASMNILFKVHGSWSGKIYGLPPGVSWKETDDGFTLSFETAEELAEGGRPRDESVEVRNGSETYIKNQMDLSASTGGNGMDAALGAIDTGDAYAAANVINVANTNMIGRNMFWAIVNIFGDWEGDLSFGKPDLWIGGHAEMDGSSLRPGGTVTYHMTVMNNGDIAADSVEIVADLGSSHLSSDNATIDVGQLRPGESRSYEIAARLSEEMPKVREMITSKIKVRSAQKDDNSADNEELVSFVIDNDTSSSKRNRPRVRSTIVPTATTSSAAKATTTLPKLEVTKTHSALFGISAGGTADYTIKVYNPTDLPAYDARLADRLTDAAGRLVHEEIWDLGVIAPHEEVTIEYSTRFKIDAPTGMYVNKARASALSGTTTDSIQIWSNVGTASVRVTAVKRPAGLPLSAAPIDDAAATATATTTEVVPDSNPLVLEAHAAGSSGLLAAAFFASPTGKQLTMFTLLLLATAIGILAYRRRTYTLR